jgi:hypothetical protein
LELKEPAEIIAETVSLEFGLDPNDDIIDVANKVILALEAAGFRIERLEWPDGNP